MNMKKTFNYSNGSCKHWNGCLRWQLSTGCYTNIQQHWASKDCFSTHT